MSQGGGEAACSFIPESKPVQQEDFINDAVKEFFQGAKHIGSALAVRFFYGFLYHFLRRKHKRSDHPLEVGGNLDDDCSCPCVLDRSVDLFLDQCSDLPSAVRESLHGTSYDKSYVLLCDPVHKKLHDVDDAIKRFFGRNGLEQLKLRKQQEKVQGVEFFAQYKKTLPVYFHKSKQRVIIMEFSTPSVVLGKTLVQIINAIDKPESEETPEGVNRELNSIMVVINNEFIEALKALLEEEKSYVNTDYFRILPLKITCSDGTFRDIETTVDDLFVESSSTNSEERVTGDSGSFEFDLDSLDRVNILNFVFGFLYPVTFAEDFIGKIFKYYIIFPKSGDRSGLEREFHREKIEDVSVTITRGGKKRTYELQAYQSRKTKKIFHFEIPPFLDFYKHLKGESSPNSVTIHSPTLFDAYSAGISASISWDIGKKLKKFCQTFSATSKIPFNFAHFSVCRWDDTDGGSLEDELTKPSD